MNIGRAAWWPSRAVLRATLLIVVALFIVLFLPVWLPSALFDRARRASRQRHFIREHASHVFLVWHARRGWYDFVRNNVLPALPPNVIAVQDRRHGGEDLAMIRRTAAPPGRACPSHPFLAKIGQQHSPLISLNMALQSMKSRRRRDKGVQDEMRQLLGREADRLAASVE